MRRAQPTPRPRLPAADVPPSVARQLPAPTGSRARLVLLISGLVLSGAVLLGGWRWYSLSLRPVSGDSAPRLVQITAGSSSQAVAQQLQAEGVIRQRWAFRLYLRIHGGSGHLQAGSYYLNAALSAPEIARILIIGETAERRLTIKPGMTLAQIADALIASGYSAPAVKQALAADYEFSLLKDKPKKATLEGYLFPDTYIVSLDTPVHKMIELILGNSEEKITHSLRRAWQRQGLDIHEALTMASMIEKETSNPSDQRQVAQVFYRRLKLGMKLQADPTFLYGAGLLGVTPTVDLDSPYNTYLHKGLPPGPITTPDIGALTAVAHPASGKYLYFIADRSGKTHFALTAEKHKRNIEQYLQ